MLVKGTPGFGSTPDTAPTTTPLSVYTMCNNFFLYFLCHTVYNVFFCIPNIFINYQIIITSKNTWHACRLVRANRCIWSSCHVYDDIRKTLCTKITRRNQRYDTVNANDEFVCLMDDCHINRANFAFDRRRYALCWTIYRPYIYSLPRLIKPCGCWVVYLCVFSLFVLFRTSHRNNNIVYLSLICIWYRQYFVKLCVNISTRW